MFFDVYVNLTQANNKKLKITQKDGKPTYNYLVNPPIIITFAAQSNVSNENRIVIRGRNCHIKREYRQLNPHCNMLS